MSKHSPDKIGFSEPPVTSWAMKRFVETCEMYNQRFRQSHGKIAGLLQSRTEVSVITSCVTSLSYWLSAEINVARLRYARWRKLVMTSLTVDRQSVQAAVGHFRLER